MPDTSLDLRVLALELLFDPEERKEAQRDAKLARELLLALYAAEGGDAFELATVTSREVRGAIAAAGNLRRAGWLLHKVEGRSIEGLRVMRLEKKGRSGAVWTIVRDF